MRRALTAAAASLLAGCAFITPDRIHYRVDAAPAATSRTPDSPDLVGVALSGGGSRAAVFAAAALEALFEQGVLQQATHISSVSGGGFAASYYLVKRPADAEGFAAFRTAMRRDFFAAMEARQLRSPGRFSSPTRRLSSLQDALDRAFLDGAAFADLPSSPIFIINAARYDDARRFVFSPGALADEPLDFEPYTDERLRAASFSLPGCARPTPADFPLSLAVAISAAFPVLLGPATIEAHAECDGGETLYWHLGDGGILENTGVEALVEIAARARRSVTPPRRVLIVSIDAGRETDSKALFGDRNLRLWTRYPGRVVEIAATRAEAWRAAAQRSFLAAGEASADIVVLRYTDAQLTEWPASCGRRAGDPAAIAGHIAAIPTSLRISTCDADLMEAAARDVARRAFAGPRWESPESPLQK